MLLVARDFHEWVWDALGTPQILQEAVVGLKVVGRKDLGQKLKWEIHQECALDLFIPLPRLPTAAAITLLYFPSSLFQTATWLKSCQDQSWVEPGPTILHSIARMILFRIKMIGFRKTNVLFKCTEEVPCRPHDRVDDLHGRPLGHSWEEGACCAVLALSLKWAVALLHASSIRGPQCNGFSDIS